MEGKSEFSAAGFAAAIARTMLAFSALFLILMTFVYFELGAEQDWGSQLPLIVAAFVYLSFIVAWAFAYTRYARFPERQKLLLLGVMIGAGLICLLGIVEIFTSPERFPDAGTMLLHIGNMYLFGIVGAAFQLYALVILLRYVFRARSSPF